MNIEVSFSCQTHTCQKVFLAPSVYLSHSLCSLSLSFFLTLSHSLSLSLSLSFSLTLSHSLFLFLSFSFSHSLSRTFFGKQWPSFFKAVSECGLIREDDFFSSFLIWENLGFFACGCNGWGGGSRNAKMSYFVVFAFSALHRLDSITYTTHKAARRK